MVVQNLAKNKASGPDGMPNEFAQINWPALKDHIMTVAATFFHHQLDLTTINRANIIMIPKKENAQLVTDFRPISIINLLPKKLAKLLANQLSPTLPSLINPHQTAFIKGHFIVENFIATREILSHVAASKRPTVLIKIDFLKVFDLID